MNTIDQWRVIGVNPETLPVPFLTGRASGLPQGSSFGVGGAGGNELVD
jgi:hypothetical protein